ncbi:MAG TPA: DNA polymerase III subunit gamma/tau [Chitinophagaceae bacterium]|nr:DNA polymerase III subunit gamma/tau [Chitinophagaceae bacterium]
MEKFIVSARKYRPLTFDTVVGQNHITTTLKNAIIHNQLAHAFLFCGPRGVGKTTCARILSKTINCENPTKEGEACNTCSSCLSFQEGGSLNYFELDAASNNSVDDIRELVTQVRFVPQSGKYKVYVIDEVHMLSAAAFNAFLKTLEEPPAYAIFILATTEKHKIIPTILSRCQIFDFKRITLPDTVQHLQEICDKEEIKTDKASLQVIAQKSEGCMRDALSILDKIVSFTNGELTYSITLEHLNILDADCYFRFLEQMEGQDLSGALLLYDEINRKGFEGDLVLSGFAEFIRNLLVCKDEKAAVLLEVVDNFREKYIAVAGKTSSSLLLSALNVLNEAEIHYKAARNKRLHTELTLIKLCYLRQAIEVSADSNGLNKKKIIESARPLAFRAITPFSLQKPVSTGKKTTMGSREPVMGAKLIVETPSPGLLANEPSGNEEAYVSEDPVRSMEDSMQEQTGPASAIREKTIETGRLVKGNIPALDKIRKQYLPNVNNGTILANQPLVQEVLQNAWNEYIRQLKQQKNPAVQSFEFAQLRVNGENSFEVITTNNIGQKFIEQERVKLFPFLHQLLGNRALQFNVVIEEQKGQQPVTEISLTAREQYLKMAEQYPLVKELKERLKLELDY